MRTISQTRCFLLLVLILCHPSLASTSENNMQTASRPHRVDEEGTVTQSESQAPDLSNAYVLVPEISIVNPSTLKLSTNDYQFPYSNKISGLPLLQVGIAKRYLHTESLQLYAVLKGGYGFKSGVFQYVNRSGTAATSDFALHWLPLSLSTKIVYDIAGAGFLKPTLMLGGGVYTLFQGGGAPGTTGSFFIPFALVSPGITLMDNTSPQDWFGGFSFNLSYLNSVASSQALRAWTFDLSLNIIL